MTRASAGIRIGVLGGTLDPIHCGHLDAAAAARDALGLRRVLIVPSHVPPHRSVQPAASPFHRFAMASLAVNGVPRLEVSDDELRTPGPSYTANTLDRLHALGWSSSQLFFITGADAFAEIASWHRYPEVMDLAHFIVISRPGYDLAELARRVPGFAGRMKPAAADADARDRSIFLLPAATPNVSSTAIRERVSRGESIQDLVPPLVERHIRQHGLYEARSANQLHGED
jgi:nicotinate-nucleotide adenylyltransferase